MDLDGCPRISPKCGKMAMGWVSMTRKAIKMENALRKKFSVLTSDEIWRKAASYGRKS